MTKKKIEVQLDLSDYVIISDLKGTTCIDTSKFAKKTDSCSLKSDIDKLDIYKLETTSIHLSVENKAVKNMLLTCRDKYITTNNFNKISGTIQDKKFKTNKINIK